MRRGSVGGDNTARRNIPPTPDQKKDRRRVQNQTKHAAQKPSTSQKTLKFKGRPSCCNHNSDTKTQHARHLEVLS